MDFQEIEMTRPVSTLHTVKQKKFGGDVEENEMCFYITSEWQANPPQPIPSSPVYIYERPTMMVYSRTFGGFVMTSAAWTKEKEVLEGLLAGKPHHDNEYYTTGYSSPWDMENRKNEVWIQCLEPAAPVIAAVVAEVEEEDEDNVVEELEAEELEVSVDPKDSTDAEVEAMAEAEVDVEADASEEMANTKDAIDSSADTETETVAEVEAESEVEAVAA